MSKKIQDAQTLNIHVVTEEFLNEVQKNRPTEAMEKCKISSWGTLPHLRQQAKLEREEKIKSGHSKIDQKSGETISIL